MLVKSALSLKEQQFFPISSLSLLLVTVIFSHAPHYGHPLKVHVPFGNHRFLLPFVCMSWFTTFSFMLGTFACLITFTSTEKFLNHDVAFHFVLSKFLDYISILLAVINTFTHALWGQISHLIVVFHLKVWCCAAFNSAGQLALLPHHPAN